MNKKLWVLIAIVLSVAGCSVCGLVAVLAEPTVQPIAPTETTQPTVQPTETIQAVATLTPTIKPESSCKAQLAGWAQELQPVVTVWVEALRTVEQDPIGALNMVKIVQDSLDNLVPPDCEPRARTSQALLYEATDEFVLTLAAVANGNNDEAFVHAERMKQLQKDAASAIESISSISNP